MCVCVLFDDILIRRLALTFWGSCSVINESEGRKHQAVQVKTRAAPLQRASINLELAHRHSHTWKKTQTQRHGGGCPALGCSEGGFRRKASFDKYSTSGRLKGRPSLVSAATHRIYKHVPIPPEETKGPARRFPWERRRSLLEETTFQPNKFSTGRKKKQKAGRNSILMSDKEHFLPRGPLRKSHGLQRE